MDHYVEIAHFTIGIISPSGNLLQEDMQRICDWVSQQFPGAVIEEKTYHGQLRFTDKFGLDISYEGKSTGDSSIVKLFSKLEESKEGLGVQFYSESQTTLDQVFLTIVREHNIAEENPEPAISSSKE
ncbi:hypothetical protein BBP40_007472 [Aspergillus hancockii]|nr:hypothetical protein BBP40_007472 [Aspergillus hancockii]